MVRGRLIEMEGGVGGGIWDEMSGLEGRFSVAGAVFRERIKVLKKRSPGGGGERGRGGSIWNLATEREMCKLRLRNFAITMATPPIAPHRSGI